MSMTRFQVMVSGSMSRRNSRRFSSGVSSAGSVLAIPSFFRRRRSGGAKRRRPFLSAGQKALNELLVVLGGFVEDPRVDGGGQEVVGGRDGVDVAGQVEVEVLHGHDLAIAAARRRRP